MLTSTGTTYTRVAVAQLAYHPAALVGRRSPLEDPLFDPKGGPDSLLPARGEVPEALAAELDALRVRIRNAHGAQLLGKIQAVLAACRAWKVRLVVFPEYSIPWEILGGVAEAAGDMVVVAGTHAVDRAARRERIYERLAAAATPAFGQAVCPVLHQQRIVAIQPKLHPAIPERGSMKVGDAWAPIAMPEGIVGPLGVLVCLDFLYRESEAHARLVAGKLPECRFLAVPSLTPHYTLPEFAGKAWEEARRYGRPVLYCDGAEGGGTAIYVDEGQPYDLRRFPDRAGHLEPGDEGVIVADVNLGYERPGRSTRYGEARPVIPVAEATLVYRAHPAGRAYAEWLSEAGELFAREDDEAVEALDTRVIEGREVLLGAGALTGAAARGRRLRRLVAEIGKVTSVEEIRQFTREVVLPEDLLPLTEVRRAMAAGAADAIFEWMKRPEVRAAGFGEVEARLREAAGGKGGPWTRAAEAAVAALARAVRGEVKAGERAAPAEVPVKVVLPSGVDPAALGMREHGGWVLSFKARPGDVHAILGRDELEGMESVAPRERRRGEGRVSTMHARAADNLYLLAVAQGADRVAVVAAWPETRPADIALLIASSRGGGWALWPVGSERHGVEIQQAILAGIVASGLDRPVWDPITDATFLANVAALAPAFDGARAVVRSLREQRLREVNDAFVEPHAVIGGHAPEPVLAALDAWLPSTDQTALVLGEFGIGKSTVLAEWAWRRWEKGEPPFLLVVNLAGVGPAAAPDALLLQAAGLDDTPRNRAALRLLIRTGHFIPCFDGFDEMATRLEAAELAGRLSALLEVASGGGKVLISSRTNYFPSKDHLRTAAESALAQALGASAGIRRIEIQPFSDEQVAALVRKIRTEEGAADRALDRIAHIYDLRDLVHRPLLLGMVLKTLDSLEMGARVGRADLYEAYLARWLEQTRKEDPECFTDAQKTAFAEALAEELWRSGQPSCTWQELQKSVRMRLVPDLREGVPVGAALLEMQGGAFFVHEGEDRYRFAHKSFLEYFLARSLVNTLDDRPVAALATRPITPEVAAFVGEILRREGDPLESKAVRAAAAWTVDAGNPEVVATLVDTVLETTAGAAANALRLLLGLARWASDGRAWIPQGMDLRRVSLVKEDLRGASLVRANLEGAELSGAELSGVDLSGSRLVGARLRGVRLLGAKLVGVRAKGADFTFAEADEVDLRGADLTDAVLRQSMWTGCRWEGVNLEGAEVTGWAAPGFGREGALGVLALGLESVLAAGHGGAVRSVAWSPDGTRVVSGGDDTTVRLWDAATGIELFCLKGHTHGVNAVGWSPDGTRVVSGGDDTTVRLWDAATGIELFCLKGHTHGVNAVGWSPDGTRVASSGYDNTVRLWDAGSGTELLRLEGHAGLVTAVGWSPDGTRVVGGGSDKTVRLWDAATGVELSRLEGHAGLVTAVGWSPDGTRVVSGGDDTTMRLRDAGSGTELSRFEGHTSSVMAVGWSPDGTRVVSGGHDNTVRLWDARSGNELFRLEGHAGLVTAVGWSPDGARVASGGSDKTVRLWDAATGTELFHLEGHAGLVTVVGWSPDGTRVVSGGSDKTVRLWDAATGTELSRLEGHAGLVTAAGWSPDGTRVVSGGYDKTVRLWDVATGVELSCLAGHAEWVRAVGWSPDGTCVVSGGDDTTVRLWDARSGTELSCLEGHASSVMAVGWSPDGTRVVSGGYDTTVRLWDARSGTELSRLEGHSSSVMAVGWSPDGTRVVSGGYDSTVRLWDPQRALLLTTLEIGGQSTVARTRGGYRLFRDTPTAPARLALRRPDSRTTLYLPLAGLRRVLHRPDKVRAALAGDLSGDDLRPELERLGWLNGTPWDGKAHRIPHAPSKSLESARATTIEAPSDDIDNHSAILSENPFSPGPALAGELPPGREPTIDELLALIRKKRPAPAILRGPRRSGKTSLLHHLRARLARTHTVRFVTLEGRTQPIRTADDLARVIEPSLTSKAPADSLRKRLGREKKPVLLLDEVANLLDADASTFSWLRAVGQEGAGVVLAGSHWDWVRVVERAASIMPGSSFGNDVTPVTLGPLREADALRFLVETAPPDVPLASDGAARWILELCGPWPFYLQVMGYAVVQEVRMGERRALVERYAMKSLYDQRLLLDRSDSYFATRWSELPERARAVVETVRTLPEGKRPVFREQSPEDRRALLDTGLCNALGVWIEDRPLFDWIVRIEDEGRR